MPRLSHDAFWSIVWGALIAAVWGLVALFSHEIRILIGAESPGHEIPPLVTSIDKISKAPERIKPSVPAKKSMVSSKSPNTAQALAERTPTTHETRSNIVAQATPRPLTEQRNLAQINQKKSQNHNQFVRPTPTTPHEDVPPISKTDFGTAGEKDAKKPVSSHPTPSGDDGFETGGDFH